VIDPRVAEVYGQALACARAVACRSGSVQEKSGGLVTARVGRPWLDRGLNQVSDAFVVQAPPGFYALPFNGLEVEDNTKGVIEIFPGSIS
jgi:hypothetical protein